MSRQQFTPEFKHEAVRQVTEKGHSVQEVAARMGVSSHSLYKWVKAVRPEKDERRADELLDARREILKLRAELRRVEPARLDSSGPDDDDVALRHSASGFFANDYWMRSLAPNCNHLCANAFDEACSRT